jgi:hypothetical protein
MSSRSRSTSALIGVSVVIRGGFLFGMSLNLLGGGSALMDNEQRSGAIGLGWDLDGNDLKLAASVICFPGSARRRFLAPWSPTLAECWPLRVGRILCLLGGAWPPE